MVKRNKNMALLKSIIVMLENNEKLPTSARDHKLVSNWTGRRECHIEPDWLLIYKIPDESTLLLERTGSHADLFK